MRFDIITIFPEAVRPYFNSSIIKRARNRKLIDVRVWNLRDFSADKHKKVDDRPYGGGAGMVLSAEPIVRAAEKIIKSGTASWEVILLSAKGKQFTQKMAQNWAKKKTNLLLISGRYEGIDERVKLILKDIAKGRKISIREISMGPYVLTDGDVPAMAIVSAVARLLPGVIKNESLREESFSGKLLEYPQYTRPEAISWHKKIYRVPRELLTGHHARIRDWRQAKRRTS